MFTRFTVVCALLGALLTSSVSPTLALSESQQDAAIASLQATVASQQTQINTLKGLLSSFSKKTDTTRTDGKKGTELYITGMNLHVVNGLGATDGDTGGGVEPSPQTNGLGNVIIGYNATRSGGPNYRGGSHNLVLGDANNYSSYGGIVAGTGNYLDGPYSSVLSGDSNTVSGDYSAILGGYSCTISIGASYASLVGGQSNTVSSFGATVGGGIYNTANAQDSSVTGGAHNTASGGYSSVSGGDANTASGGYASVSGGYGNTASGYISSISGGYQRGVSGNDDWAAGSLFQDN